MGTCYGVYITYQREHERDKDKPINAFDSGHMTHGYVLNSHVPLSLANHEVRPDPVDKETVLTNRRSSSAYLNAPPTNERSSNGNVSSKSTNENRRSRNASPLSMNVPPAFVNRAYVDDMSNDTDSVMDNDVTTKRKSNKSSEVISRGTAKRFSVLGESLREGKMPDFSLAQSHEFVAPLVPKSTIGESEYTNVI